MDPALNIFIEELKSSYSSSCVRDAVETLLKIHRNIYYNRNDTKYKTLKLNNQAFCRKVWNMVPAQHFMLNCGWKQVDDTLQFDNDSGLLVVLNTLLEHRYVEPKSDEWKTETKVENLYTSKQHDEKLRAKAAEERRKELEEFKKDKLYRQQLAQQVKQNIADDRARNREVRYTEPEPAVRQQNAEYRPRNRPLPSNQTVGKRLCD